MLLIHQPFLATHDTLVALGTPGCVSQGSYLSVGLVANADCSWRVQARVNANLRTTSAPKYVLQPLNFLGEAVVLAFHLLVLQLTTALYAYSLFKSQLFILRLSLQQLLSFLFGSCLEHLIELPVLCREAVLSVDVAFL